MEHPGQRFKERHMTFLFTQRKRMVDIDKSHGDVPSLAFTSSFKETAETKHGMSKWIWKGRMDQPFIQFVESIMPLNRNTFWLHHLLANDPAQFDRSIHDSVFRLEVASCSLGALTDPFTFADHATWTEDECMGITATFDFVTERFWLEFGALPDTITRLEFKFSELTQAVIVHPKKEEGDTFYDLYLYFGTTPSIWQSLHISRGYSKPKLFKRIIELHHSSECDIGKCSVLKLELINAERDLPTLLDKLDASQFNVWWSAIKTVPGKNGLLYQDEDAPWSVRWLLSEGYRVSDQLKAHHMRLLHAHEEILYDGLKGVIGREIMVDVMHELNAYRMKDKSGNVSLSLPPDYLLIAKVMVTPTRLIFIPPEPVHTNRVLRKFHRSDNFITVSFRDENQEPLAPTSLSALRIPIERIKRFLNEGLTIKGRTYQFLGSSNSQLRQHGCWMFAPDADSSVTVEEIRRWMGDLANIRSVALYVARLGQCFSSSTNTVDLSNGEYSVEEIPDVERNGYCFTDGTGKISSDLAEQVAKKCDIEGNVSALQIRLGGWKGVVSVDTHLKKGCIQIRPSMKKFDSSHKILEVLDHSRPRLAFLNRQIVTLLSQRGIADTVFLRLQQEYIQSLLKMFTSSEKACEQLERFLPAIKFRDIWHKGIDITMDPYIRTLLQIIYEERLDDLLGQCRIPIPPEKGRTLVGIADETGRLCSGEVFIQYSTNYEASTGETSIVQGPVMVTKSPCLHPGDIRVFEAVDRRELRHLVNCLVFPVKGDRPHCDEISGSDLDGDLYWTTWHEDLSIRDNDEPMTYQKAPVKRIDHEPTQEDIIEYLGECISHSSELGRIASAHMVLADREEMGIYSESCLKLARRHSIAVDFPKTGEPSYLNEALKPNQYPDFMRKNEQKQYESKRILGILFRRISRLHQSLCFNGRIINSNRLPSRESNCRIQEESLQLDVPRLYYEHVEQVYLSYATKLQQLLDKYGFTDESRMLAGFMFRKKSNRLHNSDQYEQALMMKAEVKKLFKDFADIFVNEQHSLGIQKKMLTWYKVAFVKRRFMSFAWIALSEWASLSESTIKFRNDVTDVTEYMESDVKPAHHGDLKAKVCRLFIEEVHMVLPKLRIDMELVDLSEWCVTGNDVYIEVNCREENCLQWEFAKIWESIPRLRLNKLRNALKKRYYLTSRGIELVIRDKEEECPIHIYYRGVYSDVINELRSCTYPEILRNLLPILTEFWLVSGFRALRDAISVLNICHITIYYMKRDTERKLPNLIHNFFIFFADFSNLEQLRNVSSLWKIPHETLQLFQLNLIQGLQQLSVFGIRGLFSNLTSGTCDSCIRQMISVSENSTEFLHQEKDFVVKVLALRSRCRIEIKRIFRNLSSSYTVEGFGTRRQIALLKDEVRHFEDIAYMITNFSYIPAAAKYREPIFEDSTSNDDEINIVPYTGRSSIRHNGNKFTLVVNRNGCHEVKMEEIDTTKLEKIFATYISIVNEMSTHYDEQFLGETQIVCRFAYFHFFPGRNIKCVSVGDFIQLLNSKDVDLMPRTSYFQAYAKVGKLSRFLQMLGFVKSRHFEKTVLVNMQIPGNSNAVSVILNGRLKIHDMHHTPIRWGNIEYLRGSKGGEKMPDIYIRLETKRSIGVPNMESNAFLSNLDTPLVIADSSQSWNGMPALTVQPKYAKYVTYIRQKKIIKYKYPLSIVAKDLDYFTAHVIVTIANVREYFVGTNKRSRTFNEVHIVLDPMPPLHYEEDHHRLIQSMMNLALKIGNFISE